MKHTLTVEIASIVVIVGDMDLNFAVDLCGDNCKVWHGFGLPVYDGSIDGLERYCPELLEELIYKSYVRTND